MARAGGCRSQQLVLTQFYRDVGRTVRVEAAPEALGPVIVVDIAAKLIIISVSGFNQRMLQQSGCDRTL